MKFRQYLPRMQNTGCLALIVVLMFAVLILAFALLRCQQQHRVSVRLYRMRLKDAQQREHSRELETMRLGHELRGPITIICGWIDALVHKEFDGPARREALDRIHHSAKTLALQIEQFTDQQRLRLMRSIQRCDISQLACAIVQDFQTAFPERVIHAEIEPGVVMDTDEQGCERIFMELMQNALTHGDAQSPIGVHLRRLSQGFEFTTLNDVNQQQSQPTHPLFPDAATRTGYGQYVVRHWSDALQATFDCQQQGSTYRASVVFL